ncbi:hypothetical protein [Rhizobium paknamense]|uniref:Uncharacterized protein n=1 Tax=Rhizobium paknamense TaxID=1206817 RepID=A0ABU0I7Y4_9HYPH|nr:hypothetical protein [Rhizobium paknamense]MDQ0454338.1 hypothetical protein [Rhizobium paknamense]
MLISETASTRILASVRPAETAPALKPGEREGRFAFRRNRPRPDNSQDMETPEPQEAEGAEPARLLASAIWELEAGHLQEAEDQAAPAAPDLAETPPEEEGDVAALLHFLDPDDNRV